MHFETGWIFLQLFISDFSCLKVYKDSHGYSYAVSEMLQRSAQKEDNFLREMRVKVFEITGRLVVFEALNTVSFNS